MSVFKDYSKENVARLKAKPLRELTTKEKIILQNVEISKIVAYLKEKRGEV